MIETIQKRAKEDAAMLAISPPDPGRKLELRMMFLEIVKGYIGERQWIPNCITNGMQGDHLPRLDPLCSLLLLLLWYY